ncbi:hypothetical protein CHU98_g11083 [Xylaria longipes]|nr:hypothetical protein CHU98_g11083 [Xylaria longipes]
MLKFISVSSSVAKLSMNVALWRRASAIHMMGRDLPQLKSRQPAQPYHPTTPEWSKPNIEPSIEHGQRFLPACNPSAHPRTRTRQATAPHRLIRENSLPDRVTSQRRSRRKMGNSTSMVLDNIVQGTNFDREEVERLKKRFMKLDKDQNGTIERDEFLSLPQISSNPLATRLIAIFDEDGGGSVDFQEFVSGLSAFSSKGNKEQKLQFAFKVYDIDRDGYISNGELFIVLKMMVGSNLKDQQLQQIVDKTIMEADLDKDGKISFEEFTRMVENTDVSMSMTLDQF